MLNLSQNASSGTLAKRRWAGDSRKTAPGL